MKKKISAMMIVGAMCFIGACRQQSAESSLHGVLEQLAGEVKLNGQSMKYDVEINRGDVIETGESAMCRIVFGDSVIELGPQSRLVFNLAEDNNELSLERGRLSGLTGALFKGGYRITTPAVLAAVRGTAYFVQVEDPQNTYFCVCNGTIGLGEPGSEELLDISATHHNGARFTRLAEGKVQIDRNAGMLYHGDADIEKLARTLGRQMKWQ